MRTLLSLQKTIGPFDSEVAGVQEAQINIEIVAHRHEKESAGRKAK
jgi:hypothetical protein